MKARSDEGGAWTKLDFETKNTSYMVTVTATDPGEPQRHRQRDHQGHRTWTNQPMIMVGGLAISGDAAWSVEEGNTVVATYTATGPNADTADWTLSGDDAGDFSISSAGVLTFASLRRTTRRPTRRRTVTTCTW